LSNPLGPNVVLTVSATAITALEFDSKALNSMFSAIGFQTPKFRDDDIFLESKIKEIKVSEMSKKKTKAKSMP